ncbi:hypothetical protein [Streptomyces iconiensis]|uniref:Uncharacterized protein n=1 Tax=Streptomyces iconiensis TaxID=1384038 RepID=A0ABT6ZN47_9ACTN|nr:hypothetical protein [Streptomyces iconiensis]MDJ1130489.1 hypothetical protein [Streptomyces iconiensis]
MSGHPGHTTKKEGNTAMTGQRLDRKTALITGATGAWARRPPASSPAKASG